MKHIKLLAFFFISLLLTACTKPSQEWVDFVNPFIGTGGHGHTYPGASTPFGMVQLSPDTRLTGWDGCSGYHYSDDTIFGFSHTHLSGTGVSDYGDILIMPTTGDVHLNNGAEKGAKTGYCSAFNHASESASPGYYRVLLEDYQIDAELTATPRTGIHRYTFPASEKSNILIDLLHRDKVLEASLNFKSNQEIEGFRRSDAWATDQVVYFVAQFSKPFTTYGIAVNDQAQEGLLQATGTNLKAWGQFTTEEHEQVIVKVGISAVSIAGARKNLEAETKGFNFDEIHTQTRKTWNNELGKIEVKGGDKERKTIFYTALYHSMLNPNLFMDVDGKYRGTDLKIHQANDFTNYTVFSLWDTYRATHPLFTLIDQKRTLDFIKTFQQQYQHGGQLPVWELAANYTGCMIGYHSIPVIVDAYMKGIRDFDHEALLSAMKHSAEKDHLGLKYYKKYGYIPASEESESVSKTLEYAYDDWCIARMAQSMGHDNDYQRYIQRAQYYKNIYDPSTGFMRAKMGSSWFEPFDPHEVNFNYTEANAWQYSFYVPQDIEGLSQLLGGKAQLEAKLDELFTASSQTTGREQADITGLIGQYAHGNEPSHHMAYLYNYVNKPYKTQEKVHQILTQLYSNQPDGLSGNEDCGQMSSWYVLSAMGFYPVCPGDTNYILGSPLFDEVILHLENGNQFTLKAHNLTDENIYIQNTKLNGEKRQQSYLSHQAIMQGGIFEFTMGKKPHSTWGSHNDDVPVSHINSHLINPAPFVAKGASTFLKSTEITLASVFPDATIYYSTNGKRPSAQATKYTQPITIHKNTTLMAYAVREGYPDSPVIEARYFKIPAGRSIQINSPYANQYSAGGDMALIDFVRGGDNYRTGSWQGYWGENLDVIIDLGKKEPIHQLSAGFLQDAGSWIFMPQKVDYYYSTDGVQFKHLAKVINDVPLRQLGCQVKNFAAKVPTVHARYIKVVAQSIGQCPEWHKGYPGDTWLFADEIVIN